MRVFLVIVALMALILNSEAQNITKLNVTVPNRTQWDLANFNKSQWNIPAFNKTQWNIPAFNKTQNNPSFNRTQLLSQALNRNQLQAQNRTEWTNQIFDRINLQAKNRTNGRFQLLNNSLSNVGSRNRSRWNSTSRFRPKRSDPKWFVPANNHTWNQTTHNGDIIVGQIGYLDRLLFNQTYRKESRWWSGREKIIEYPKDLGKYGVNRQETITALRVYNKFLDGLESSAKVLSGGVGYRYVKIKLSSPWNRGFQYAVQLFGR